MSPWEVERRRAELWWTKQGVRAVRREEGFHRAGIGQPYCWRVGDQVGRRPSTCQNLEGVTEAATQMEAQGGISVPWWEGVVATGGGHGSGVPQKVLEAEYR